MSIIERAENRAPVVQRRPRALFEAGPVSNDLLTTEVAVETERDARVDTHAPTFVPERRPADRPSRHAHRPIEQSEPRAAASPARPVSVRAAETPPTPRPEREVEVLEPTRHTPPEQIETPRPLPTPIASRAVDRHVAHRPVQRDAAPIESPPPIVQKRVRETSAPALDEPRRLTRAVATPIPTVPVRSTRPETKIQTPTAPRATAIPTRRESAAVLFAKSRSVKSAAPQVSVAPAPVHISIGRVEVRATAAPHATARPAKSAGPRLKLDDYLNDRDRGGR